MNKSVALLLPLISQMCQNNPQMGVKTNTVAKRQFEHLTTELVCDVIDLAVGRYAESFAEDYYEKPWPLTEPPPWRFINFGELPDEPPPRRYFDRRLRARLRGLPEPTLIELTALMWFGRGDGSWWYCLAHAKRTSRGAGEIDYLAGKPLDEYLPAALALLAFGDRTSR
jgi:hypothetical protein